MTASTRSVYDAKWKVFGNWCKRRKLNPFKLSTPKVLDFLQARAEKLAFSTIAGYVTALSRMHDRVKIPGHSSMRLGRLPSVRTWLAGLKKSKGIPRVIVPTWNLEVVLSALKRAPYHPVDQIDLKSLTLKTVFLVALTSARRASEIHALRSDMRWGDTSVSLHVDINFVPKIASHWHCNQPIELPAMAQDADPGLRSLCVRQALNAYIKATRLSRREKGVTQLFLCYGKKKRGSPVSKVRISQWLKMLVADCYRRMGLPEPVGVKGHQVRKQATSWADMAGVDPQKICDAATWKSECTFARHYSLDLSHKSRSDFGRKVLQKSASSSAEASLRRHLGAVPSSIRSLPEGYTIPKRSNHSISDG